MLSFTLMVLGLPFVINESQSTRVDKWCDDLREPPLQELLNYILNEMTQQSKCIVFMVDTYYRKLIKYNWRQMETLPHYNIYVRQSEEFIPPRRRLLNVLDRSKDSGCDAYVILMTNGFQASQLLEFAERNRLINTQGNFLLIHDTRLFDLEMMHIWNRIINVIFIHEFVVSTKRSDRPTKRWFNLETVHYPIRTKNFVATRYVDTWHRGRMRNANSHFVNKTQNLTRKSLSVAIFEHIPTVTQHTRQLYTNFGQHSEKALGVEFEILRVIANKLNFRPAFYVPDSIEVEKWGTMSENGTYNGLLGEAVQGKAAFLLGDLHYTLKHFELLDLSYPYNSECLTFLTPESLTETSWKLLISPFKLYTWIAAILILLIGACAIHFFALFYQEQIMPYVDGDSPSDKIVLSQERSLVLKSNVVRKMPVAIRKWNDQATGLGLFTDLVNSMLYTYSMLLQVSLPKLPKPWAVRVFIGWWWLYSILLTVAYRASMTATLANPVGRITIDTLGQLAKSTIAVGGWSEEQRELLVSSLDVDLNKIGARFQLTIHEDEAIAWVANGTFGYYENIQTLQEARAKRQLLEDSSNKNASEGTINDRNLHIMQECVIYMPISIGMDRNSPLKLQVDHIVRQVVETGLVEKWLSDVMEWSKIAEIKYESPSPKAMVDLHKLHGALVALGIGYVLGLLALLIEHVHWKYFVMRDPAFDKYQMDIFYSMPRSTFMKFFKYK